MTNESNQNSPNLSQNNTEPGFTPLSPDAVTDQPAPASQDGIPAMVAAPIPQAPPTHIKKRTRPLHVLILVLIGAVGIITCIVAIATAGDPSPGMGEIRPEPTTQPEAARELTNDSWQSYQDSMRDFSFKYLGNPTNTVVITNVDSTESSQAITAGTVTRFTISGAGESFELYVRSKDYEPAPNEAEMVLGYPVTSDNFDEARQQIIMADQSREDGLEAYDGVYMLHDASDRFSYALVDTSSGAAYVTSIIKMPSDQRDGILIVRGIHSAAYGIDPVTADSAKAVEFSNGYDLESYKVMIDSFRNS